MLVIGSDISIDSSIIELGEYLRDLGVNVYEFYHPNAIWDNIISVDKPVHIFIYKGHGTYMGENDGPGGLVISSPKFVSSNDIKNNLPLAKSALILFQSVCMAAGSSASDNSNISLNSALYRVENYAKPFIEKGAASYYAVNYWNGLKPFLEDFFQGTTAKEIYEKAFSYSCDLHPFQHYNFNRLFEISVASRMPKSPSTVTTTINGKTVVKKVGPFLHYEKAFVGKSTFCILDLLE